MSLLRIDAVKKSFGKKLALDQIALSCGSSELVFLLGSNGAGKSTMLRLCSGLARPDSGVIHFDGSAPDKCKSKIGYYSHNHMTYSNFRVVEQLRFQCHLRKLPFSEALLEEWQLSAIAHKPIKDLSTGQRARVSLAQAFAHEPRVLLLDEPSSALDDRSCEMLGQHLQSAVKQGALCIIATHDVQRLQYLASRIVVMVAGRIQHDSGSAKSISESIVYYRELNR